jgi:hypothetical protein
MDEYDGFGFRYYWIDENNPLTIHSKNIINLDKIHPKYPLS